MSKIKFGVSIDATPEMLVRADYNAIKEIALQCENLGYHSLWVMDHLTWGERGEASIFEAWTLLSALSTETKKIRLGTMVTCNSFRNPSLIAKMSSTVDVISNGRLMLGYGAGWKQDEYEAYGYSFLKPSRRARQMREGVLIIKKLWTEERTSFSGDFYSVKDAPCNPKPIQKPHPPIIIGGEGEKITLKTAAELGDGWNIYEAPIERYKQKVNILTGYCQKFGRKIEDLELSWSGSILLAEDKKQLQRKRKQYNTQSGIVSTFNECIETLQKYVSLGCTHFVFRLKNFNEEKEAFVERVQSSF